MANLIDLIKIASVDAVKASVPMQIVEGIVEIENPLSIKLNQRLIISGSGVVKPKYFRKHEFILNGEKAELDLSLKKGDAVILLQNVGGQVFYILGVRE